MSRGTRHDPVALFAFALRENDWVLAELIARPLRRAPEVRERLEAITAEASARGSSPASLQRLDGFATAARALGIGD